MATACYLSNHNMQIVDGSYEGGHLKIQKSDNYEIPAGALINGVITDEENVLEVLKQVKTTGVDDMSIVIDSGKILVKNEVIPKMKPKEIQALCKNELADLHNDDLDLVYDYRIIRDKLPDGPGMEVMFIAVETALIESYISVFKTVGIKINRIDISINAISKLCSIYPELNQKNYILVLVDENDVTSYLFYEGRFVVSNRSRIFTQRGKMGFVSELSTKINQLMQFKLDGQSEIKPEKVYIVGLENDDNEAKAYVDISNFLDTDVSRFIQSKSVETDSITKGREVDTTALYPMGCLIRK